MTAKNCKKKKNKKKKEKKKEERKGEKYLYQKSNKENGWGKLENNA